MDENKQPTTLADLPPESRRQVNHALRTIDGTIPRPAGLDELHDLHESSLASSQRIINPESDGEPTPSRLRITRRGRAVVAVVATLAAIGAAKGVITLDQMTATPVATATVSIESGQGPIEAFNTAQAEAEAEAGVDIQQNAFLPQIDDAEHQATEYAHALNEGEAIQPGTPVSVEISKGGVFGGDYIKAVNPSKIALDEQKSE